VIKQADIDQRKRILHPQRDALVGKTRLGDTGWMVVRDDDGGAVPLQRLLDDLARIDTCPIDGAPEQLLELDKPVPVIEIKAAYL
jgi:hypothetical protein